MLQSDLFENVPPQVFDIVIVNPPYYFKPVSHNSQLAWNCGENGEYFERLFSGLKNYVNEGSRVFMVLSEACDLERIFAIATRHQVKFLEVYRRRILWEENYVFSLSYSDSK